MKFAFSKELITPKSKCPLHCCPPVGQPYLQIHDDIFARASYMEDDGGNKTLIIAFDLLFHNDDLNKKLADYAEKKYGVPADAVLINYSHAHTAPAVSGYADELSSPSYEKFLYERAFDLIDRAFSTIIDGNAAYENVPCDWSMSRRKIVDGKCGGMAPSPNNLREKGMDILKFTDTDGKIRGIIVDYGTHPVHYPGKSAISSEYPGRLCAMLECEYYGATAMFLQGTAGTSRPRTTVDGERFRVPCGYSDVNMLATALFDTVKDALVSQKWSPLKLNIAGKTDSIKLDFNVEPYSYFESLRNVDMGSINNNGIAFILKNYESMDHFLMLSAGMIRLAKDLYICHMGGEPSIETKVLLQELLPDIRIIFVGYTDAISYIPTNTMIAEGGYESTCFIEYVKLGRFKPEVDEKISESFKKMYALLD